MTSRESFVKDTAKSLGFEECRITELGTEWQAEERLSNFVSNKYHGTMAWMETTVERRKHPTRMWSEAKSAIVVGLNYSPDSDPIEDLKANTRGNISVYARGDDYHDVIKKKLRTLARAFAEKFKQQVKIFVDTAPLMEKPLAHRAGVGWQGKHTNLVSREYGSWLFLGIILTDAILKSDVAETDHCGSCKSCLDICPTKAFVSPYKIDARKCISYLTIEYEGLIPHQFRKAIGNRIYGCDDCLAVCPWNKFAKNANESKLIAREQNILPRLVDLALLSDREFRVRFSNSPVKRIGRNRFLRNVLIALGNSQQSELAIDCVLKLLDEEDPIVRGTAVWALSQLNPELFEKERTRRSAMETVQEVKNEWIQGHQQ